MYFLWIVVSYALKNKEKKQKPDLKRNFLRRIKVERDFLNVKWDVGTASQQSGASGQVVIVFHLPCQTKKNKEQ